MYVLRYVSECGCSYVCVFLCVYVSACVLLGVHVCECMCSSSPPSLCPSLPSPGVRCVCVPRCVFLGVRVCARARVYLLVMANIAGVDCARVSVTFAKFNSKTNTVYSSGVGSYF